MLQAEAFFRGLLMPQANKSTFDRDSAPAVSMAVREIPFPGWTILVVAVAAGLTAIWTGVLVWVAAGTLAGLLG